MKKTKHIQVRVSEELHNKIKEYCAKNDKDISNIVRDLLKDWLNRQENSI